jgi:hypothetical protein
MEKPFELPELITLSGKQLTADMSFEELVLSGGGNTCSSGSGDGNTCSSGSGSATEKPGGT